MISTLLKNHSAKQEEVPSIRPVRRGRRPAKTITRRTGDPVMATRRTEPVPASPSVRCYTRALKNARYLQRMAPHLFAKDPKAEGFGTGVPVEILRGLHR